MGDPGSVGGHRVSQLQHRPPHRPCSPLRRTPTGCLSHGWCDPCLAVCFLKMQELAGLPVSFRRLPGTALPPLTAFGSFFIYFIKWLLISEKQVSIDIEEIQAKSCMQADVSCGDSCAGHWGSSALGLLCLVEPGHAFRELGPTRGCWRPACFRDAP